MRVRLLFSYTPKSLEANVSPPIAPPVLIEDSETGNVGEFGTWGGVMFDLPLDELTEADIHAKIEFWGNTEIFLPPAREFPSDDPYCPEFQKWRAEWWTETALTLRLALPQMMAVA